MAKIDPKVLNKLREAKGLSQEELARRAKFNKQTMSRLERGKHLAMLQAHGWKAASRQERADCDSLSPF